MLGPMIHGVVDFTWPMVIISCIIIISLRISYLIKNKERFVLYKELLMLGFIIYSMCLFQIVTFQDEVSWSTNNFIPFREILRYNIGSRLFIKNVLGNMLLFLPFGFFTSYLLDNKRPLLTVVLTLIASLSIEVVQLMIGRVFDVDDIILNVLGGTFGFYLYNILDRLGKKSPKLLGNEYFLDVLAIFAVAGIIAILL
ncbi:MAG: VanZ family protein [Tenericutes bacterium]|nr:VanZ family protein [Mycoplasmatota bacterium]